MHVYSKLSSSQRFKGWLHRPFLDLGPPAVPLQTPYHSAVVYAYRSVSEQRPFPRLHGRINSSTRESMVREAGLTDYQVDNPLDVPKPLRSPQWSLLCDCLEGWHDLDCSRQLDVLWLLNRLGLFSAVLARALVPCAANSPIDEPSAGHLLVRGIANVAMHVDGAADLNTRELEWAAAHAPLGGWAAIEATYVLAQASFRYRGDVNQGELWLARHKLAIEQADVDRHTSCMLWSRYHRVYAFLPQLQKDFVGMSAQMDSAAEWAEQMDRATPERLAEWHVLTYGCLESRVKEALLLGDLGLAEERAQALVAHTPLDPRAWLELGQVLVESDKVEEALRAYQAAARFGPPGTEVAMFMAGQCHEAQGDLEAAADAFIAAIAIDPQAVSAVERLQAIAPHVTGAAQLARWSEFMRRRSEGTEVDGVPTDAAVLPYQQYPGVLGGGAAAEAR